MPSKKWLRASLVESEKAAALSQSVPLSATPSQAAQWVQNNVTDLASAKQALTMMARLLFFIILVLRENGLLDKYIDD